MNQTAIIIDIDALRLLGLRTLLENTFDIKVLQVHSSLTKNVMSDIHVLKPGKLFIHNSFNKPEIHSFVREYKNELVWICEKNTAAAGRSLYIHASLPDIIEQLSDFVQTSARAEPVHKMELTERETEVLKLVTKGYLNKQIADKLHISLHTIISHRKNITTKLGIKTVSGLTVFAMINGLISSDNLQ